MCLRDFEDKLKKENTIYYEHLQKGDNKMSTKDWKNKEVTQLLAEAWGFKFNSLEEFDEFNGSGELQAEGDEEESVDELAQARRAPERRTPHKRVKPDEDEKKEMSEAEDEEETLDEGEEEELDEAAKPDYIDLDKDGDKEESMKKAAADAKKKKHGDDDKKNESIDPLQEAIANLLRKKLRG
jgi:hypothetical protein